MKREKRALKAAGIVLRAGAFAGGIVSICVGLMPLAFMVFNTGAAAFIGAGGVAVFLAVFWDRFDGWGRIPRRLHEVSDLRRSPAPVWWKRLRLFLSICLVLFVAGGCAVSALMMAAIYNAPGPEATVVVLGCRVYGDQPSLMLQRRLDAALEYLSAHPESPVVCAGGRDQRDPYSEAYVMARYLEAQGISPERIYQEDTSTTTRENLANAASIIRENGLPQQAAIATDAFHELRGQLYAKRSGLDGRSLPAQTPWGIAPSYWVREWLGLAKALFF